jgi:glycosyltransferase involved in cell wall biosynthesis
VGAIIAGITRTRLVFEKHSDPGSYRGGPVRNFIMRLYARVERFTARHADAVIGTGPGLAEQIRKMGGRASVHEIFDIPSSLAEARPERTAEIRRSLQQNERETLVAYVGSFAVYQGVDLMFEAMPEVIRRRPDARFVVIGGTPQEISDRKRWLAERGVETSASFVGKIPPDDLPDYLAASDILLSPRRAGVNTPLKLLDYMKAGRAIVATDVESNRLILNEQTAVLTEGTVSGFAAGIEKLVADAELRRKLGANGRRLIEEKYNFTEFKRKLKACYEAIMAEG